MASTKRRQFIKTAGLTTMGGLLPLEYPIGAKTEPGSTTSVFEETLKTLLNGKPVVGSDKILMDLPKTVDKRNSVPVNITSTIKQGLSLSILIEQNPMPLAASFTLSGQVLPELSTRLKLTKTTYVFVLVETAKVFYATKALVSMDTTGCGV